MKDAILVTVFLQQAVIFQQYFLRRSKMKSIKTSISSRLAALLAGAALFGLISQNALAAAVGTAVGTSISNSATMNYTVGGVGQTPITTTSASFVVDEKVNLTVGGGVTTNVVNGATAQATAFTVTNNSNSPLDFNLAANAIAGTFTPTACVARVESGANAGYLAAEDTATFIDELPSGSSATVYAVCDIPAGATNTQTGLAGITATARGDFTGVNGTYAATVGVGAAITFTPLANADTPGTVDIVFADIAGSEAGDAARDAKHSARNTYSIVTAALTVSKTALLLCDPSNGVTNPKNIPGAMTQWSIAVTNTGAADATLTTVTDTLAAALAHDPGTVAAGLSAPTNAATCVAGSGNQGFEVTASANRAIGTCANTQAFCYFTTNTADGLDIAGQAITATFSTILPVDAGTGHATAGLLKPAETVTVIFNTTVQ
jgi:uncharacterized repeat protein (TIGR01451 family)